MCSLYNLYLSSSHVGWWIVIFQQTLLILFIYFQNNTLKSIITQYLNYLWLNINEYLPYKYINQNHYVFLNRCVPVKSWYKIISSVRKTLLYSWSSNWRKCDTTVNTTEYQKNIQYKQHDMTCWLLVLHKLQLVIVGTVKDMDSDETTTHTAASHSLGYKLTSQIYVKCLRSL